MNYPTETRCYCGEIAYLKYKTIVTWYEDNMFRVNNVPMYSCSIHDKLARLTRVRIKQLLQEAYNNNKDEVEYH